MMYLGLLFFFLQKEARRLFWTKPRIAYFSKAKNLTEVVLLVTNALLISMWLSVLLDPRRLDFTVNSPAFVDMFTVRRPRRCQCMCARGCCVTRSLTSCADSCSVRARSWANATSTRSRPPACWASCIR